MMKLNLGCGNLKMEGFINVDYRTECSPDEAIDLIEEWPWLSSSIDEIMAVDILEHLPDLKGQPAVPHFMEQAYRVLKPEGRLFIQTVHFKSQNYFIDPTHVRAFCVESFDFFCPGTHWGDRASYYSKARFRKIGATIREGNVLVTLEKI